MEVRKIKKTPSLFDGELWRLLIEQAKAAKMGYTVKYSTYTIEIISPFADFYFMQDKMNPRCFGAANGIKKDIKSYLEQLAAYGEPPPIIDRRVNYYQFAMPERLKQTGHTIYNIDIKSAYASVLAQHELITPATASNLSSLAKKDRLASVGMLASNKYSYTFNEENVLSAVEYNEGEYSDFFYFCIRHTQKLMETIQEMLGKDFLFYWVDGIYFENIKHRGAIEKYLQEEGYRNSFDILEEFHAFENNKQFTIYFEKEGKQKMFKVPKPQKGHAKELVELLGLHSDDFSVIKKHKNTIK
jgi:hypothetical protein